MLNYRVLKRSFMGPCWYNEGQWTPNAHRQGRGKCMLYWRAFVAPQHVLKLYLIYFKTSNCSQFGKEQARYWLFREFQGALSLTEINNDRNIPNTKKTMAVINTYDLHRDGLWIIIKLTRCTCFENLCNEVHYSSDLPMAQQWLGFPLNSVVRKMFSQWQQ